MSAAEIILIGAGGHAAACIDVIEQDARFRIAGLLGLENEVGTQVLGYSVLGSDAELAAFAGRFKFAIIAIGQIKSPELRRRMFQTLKAAGVEFPSIVSPRAHVSRHAKLGEGTIVLHGAVVNARASVGRNCIINSKALIEHDVEIGDHCHVATAAVVNGGAKVGAGTFIGSNSTVRQVVNIGQHCVIGMAQVVHNDCADGTQLPAAGAL